MQNTEHEFFQDIYSHHLKEIRGVKFTRREVDVIAFLISGRSAKRIGSILSLSPKTIANYTHNIMIKLSCGSKENIIDFIEKSDKLLFIKKYHAALLREYMFEKCFTNISTLKSGESLPCLIVYYPTENSASSYINHLSKYLKMAGIVVSLEARDKSNSLPEILKERHENTYVVYNLDKKWIEEYQQAFAHGAVKANRNFPNLPDENNNKLFVFPHHEMAKTISITGGGDILEPSQEDSYYSLVLEIIRRLVPHPKLDEIIVTFNNNKQVWENNYDHLNAPSISAAQASENKLELKRSKYKTRGYSLIGWKRHLFLMLVIIGVIATAMFLFKGYEEKQKSLAIRSDLTIPSESLSLSRPELIAQIKNKFKKTNKGIHTIALVGPGGAGKTTLANQYGHQQNASIIWEINAETNDSLQSAFEALAQALARKIEDQKKLKEVQEIKNPSERERKIIVFVRDHLKENSNWFLIYDNVENFADIRKYFPKDFETWGKGKIIVTTRDANIKNNKYVDHVIQVGELNPQQKFDFFVKIISHDKSSNYERISDEKTKEFLKEIPSFPLDISVAAYYLKTTEISYDEYLEKLNSNQENIADLQENILNESGNYKKTRYKIIMLTLQKLIKIHPDFQDLLLCISLLNSQNIPRDLLDRFKNTTVVDKFIYNLQKFSLINVDAPNKVNPLITLSIHRSTQSIIVKYFIKQLSLEKNKEIIKPILLTFINYMSSAINEDNFIKMHLCIRHGDTILKHQKLIHPIDNILITGELAYIYYILSIDKNFIETLSSCLFELENMSIQYKPYLARITSYLGIIYWGRGDFEKSEIFLKESLNLYDRYKTDDPIRIAQTLTYLGILYVDKGDQLEKAKDLIERSLTYYNNANEQNYAGLALSLAQLGNVYLKLLDYSKAKIYIEKSLQIYQNYISSEHADAGWAIALLGWVYSAQGEFEKAINLYLETLTIYKKHFPEDSLSMGWALRNLGSGYVDLNEYDKASSVLNKSLKIFRDAVGNDNIKTKWVLFEIGRLHLRQKKTAKAKEIFFDCLEFEERSNKSSYAIMRLLRYLGEAYLQENNITQAEKYFQRSYQISQVKNSNSNFVIFDKLADLYIKKSEMASDTNSKAHLKQQAISHLKHAQDILNNLALKNSSYFKNIQKKLDILEAHNANS